MAYSKLSFLLLWTFAGVLLADRAIEDQRDLVNTIRQGGGGVFHVPISEMRMALTQTLVQDYLRSRPEIPRGILVLVPNQAVSQQYMDYFASTSRRTVVGTSLASLSSMSLVNRNVTLTTARALSRALHAHSLELGQLALVIADDASDLTHNQFDEMALQVPASGSPSSSLKVVAFSRTEDRQQQGPTTTQDSLGLGTAALGLPFPARLVVDMLSSYTFNDRSLLIRALLHPAKARQLGSDASYEPLDFVGHFALNFVLSRYIVRNGSWTNKEDMHNLMTEMLRQETCAFLAAKNSLDLHVFLDDGQEKRAMVEYATAARAQDYAGRSFLAKQKSFLHNFFKSVAGAVYVDSGYDPDALERVYLRLFKPYMDARPATS